MPRKSLTDEEGFSGLGLIKKLGQEEQVGEVGAVVAAIVSEQLISLAFGMCTY